MQTVSAAATEEADLADKDLNICADFSFFSLACRLQLNQCMRILC